jgi:hypothetical protein
VKTRCVMLILFTHERCCYRVVSGELFNQSWVQLDEEIRSLQVRNGLLLSQ